MAIPESIRNALASSVWRRPDAIEAERALGSLGIPELSEFYEFYMNYAGPFGSKSVGHELLDICEQADTILTLTEIVRTDYRFPDRFIVISNLIGGSVLVYDVDADLVYDMDFEGGDALLLAGELAARWGSWTGFLCDYFS